MFVHNTAEGQPVCVCVRACVCACRFVPSSAVSVPLVIVLSLNDDYLKSIGA